MDTQYVSKRLWLLRQLNNKVKTKINRLSSAVLNDESEYPNDKTLESISNLLSLEWKLSNQTCALKNQLKRLKVKVGAQR